MEIHRPHHEERSKQRLQDCINLGPRGAAKTGKTKDIMEKDSGEREREKAGWKSWSEVQMAAADRDGGQDCVEALIVPHGPKKIGNSGEMEQHFLIKLGQPRGMFLHFLFPNISEEECCTSMNQFVKSKMANFGQGKYSDHV